MNLIVHELVTTLTQRMTVGDNDVRLGAIRPHILKYGTPAGSLYMEVKNTSGTSLQTSETVTIASITAATNTYFHGYIKFLTYITLLKNTSYDFILTPTGYTFAESAYIGWCNDFDLQKYDRDYTPADSFDCPLDMELWEYKLITRGSYP